MGSLTIIIALILIGLILLGVELFLIPGTTIVGILGFLFTIGGVVVSFSTLGTSMGFLVMAISIASAGLMLYIGIKGNVWQKFSLKDQINSKFNEDVEMLVSLFEEGKTISALRPMGKAEFRKGIVEVRSMGGYLPTNTNVRVIKIQDKIIMVEAIAETVE
jgi:membrane-bound ClpP family serine protease